MALKGLDIFKLSPKKNCKECGSPTCMAFCMKVAQGAVALDKCPYFSEEAKAKLSEATAPPMKTITVGNDIKLGGETVLFRHEKTLVNRNRFAVPVCTCMDEAAADQKLADIQKVDYERIGEREYIEFVMVRCEKDSADKWEDLVKKAAATARTLILNCTCPECAKKALAICKDGKLIGIAAPPRRVYAKWGQMQFAEAAVIPSLGNEFYATLMAVDQQNRAVFRLSSNPLVN